MAFLAAAMPYIALAGAGAQAITQREAGKTAEANSRIEAAQEERAANASQAEGQREYIQETRRAKVAQSRARAVAASSGGRASDPTVQNMIGSIGAQGEYNALSALYSSDTDAELSRMAATNSRRMGRARRRAANMDATSTILSGAKQFAYG